MSRLLLRALSTYVASIHSLGLPLRINGKLMERIKVNLIMRVFVPSITWNLITRVLAFYHMKLPQSTELEQERCDPRSEAGVRSTPWLWVNKLWEWIEIWPPKTPVVQAKPERQICRHKKRNILKTTYPVLISQSELFFHLSEGSGKAGHLNFISFMRCAILIGKFVTVT